MIAEELKVEKVYFGPHMAQVKETLAGLDEEFKLRDESTYTYLQDYIKKKKSIMMTTQRELIDRVQ